MKRRAARVEAEPTAIAVIEPAPGAGLAHVGGAPAPRPLLDGLDAEAEGYARAAKSDNTVRAYEGAWKRFVAWCAEQGLAPVPASPESVANYLATRARTLKSATVQIDLAAIRQAHLLAGHRSPGDAPKV